MEAGSGVAVGWNVGILQKVAAAFRPKRPTRLQGGIGTLTPDGKYQFNRLELGALMGLVRSETIAKTRGYDWKDEAWKGIRSRVTGTKLRWTPADREAILDMCNQGDMFSLGLFLDAMRADPMVYGIMSTRVAMLGQPIQWQGKDQILIDRLNGREATYDPDSGAVLDPGYEGDFYKMFPLEELESIMWDGDLSGMGIGEFVVQSNGEVPRLRHLPIHWLQYNYDKEQWEYRSPVASYVVKPGDGRFFLYTPYGAEAPWRKGAWLPCAIPVIAKATSDLDRLRYMGSYADPLKFISVGENDKDRTYDELAQFCEEGWRRDGYLVLKAPSEAKLVESTGRAYEIFKDNSEAADSSIALVLAGQPVTSSGSPSGWNAGSLWRDIADSIINKFAARLAEAVQKQGLNLYAGRLCGRPARVYIRWDVRSPERKVAEAESLGKLAESVMKNDTMLKPRGFMTDYEMFYEQHGFTLPVKPIREEILQAAPSPPQLEESNVMDAEYEVIMDDDDVQDVGTVE